MAVAQDAAAIFAIKQANEKVSTNKHKAKGLGQAFFPKGAGTVKTHDTAIAFFVIYSHICHHTFVYIYPIRKNYNYLH